MRSRTGMASTSPLPSAILVHEYVTGGGWPAPDLPPGLAEEALAILRALLADLRAWGRFPVVTTRDRRLRTTGLVADRVVDLDAEVYPTALLELARDCGAALVVAPEGGGALEHLSSLVLDAGVCLLGSRRCEGRRRSSCSGTWKAPRPASRCWSPAVARPRSALTGSGCARASRSRTMAELLQCLIHGARRHASSRRGPSPSCRAFGGTWGWTWCLTRRSAG